MKLHTVTGTVGLEELITFNTNITHSRDAPGSRRLLQWLRYITRRG
jgi:hypothetical protein